MRNTGTGTFEKTAVTNFVTNTTDGYTASGKVYYIVTLSQIEYDAIGVKDGNTLYVIV